MKERRLYCKYTDIDYINMKYNINETPKKSKNGLNPINITDINTPHRYCNNFNEIDQNMQFISEISEIHHHTLQKNDSIQYPDTNCISGSEIASHMDDVIIVPNLFLSTKRINLKCSFS